MNKLTLVVLFISYSSIIYSQQNILVFKKRAKTIARFWPGSFIAFQLKDRQWQKGQITKIQNDSFYIRPTIVRYDLMGTDTVHYTVTGFAFEDVFALPKKGVLIHYVDGSFQIATSAGNVHWYWIQSGWIFRVAAIGHTALYLINGLIKNNFSLAGSKPGIAAGAFLSGVVLKRSYKPTLQLRKKYYLETLRLSN